MCSFSLSLSHPHPLSRCAQEVKSYEFVGPPNDQPLSTFTMTEDDSVIVTGDEKGNIKVFDITTVLMYSLNISLSLFAWASLSKSLTTLSNPLLSRTSGGYLLK